MDLFEAKNILRNSGYILLKEDYYNIPKDASRIVDFDGMQCYVYTHGYVSEVLLFQLLNIQEKQNIH